jgi:hypothetical protein
MAFQCGKPFGEIKRLHQKYCSMWAQVINISIGLWLMISPVVLGSDNTAATNKYIIGPIIISMAVIALSQSMRNVRYFNVLCGLWLLIAPWLISYGQTADYVNDMTAGLAVILLSLVKGNITHRFGGGWRSLFQHDPSHMQQTHPRL